VSPIIEKLDAVSGNGRQVSTVWAGLALLATALTAAAPGLMTVGSLQSKLDHQERRITDVETSGSRSFHDFKGDIRERLGRIEARQDAILEELRARRTAR
jgi:biopolymer transport protein ExbB/TolQ